MLKFKGRNLHPPPAPPPQTVTDVTMETSQTVTDATMETSQTVTDVTMETSQTVTDVTMETSQTMTDIVLNGITDRDRQPESPPFAPITDRDRHCTQWHHRPRKTA